ncbi:unnamed protein product [Phaedon cochleariae]|uniref:MYND-type domain-containing protein n=1 Tax=Phaedon cochleariae TaxID=80249 RepID=A0A9N9SJF8_PHACE|nr:unnamed protein product [Phaedon cochleariae]
MFNCPAIPYCTFFNSNVCHVCKTFDKPLKRCSSCKVMVYCSTDHQRSDWKYHKELCLIIKSASDTYKESVNTFADLLNDQYLKHIYWQEKLKRKLYDFEMQMWMFPRFCAVCYSQEATIFCAKCHNISYCSEEHKKHHQSQHEMHCNELKLSLEMDLFTFSQSLPDHYLEVSPNDIEDSISALPENLKQLMSMYDENYSTENVKDIGPHIIQIRKSQVIAPVATIIYGLEGSGFLSDRIFPKEELVVHLVGADITEMGLLWRIMSELPFHWIKNLRNFEYFIIGPDLNHSGTTDKFTNQLCLSCKSKKSTTRITFHEQLYHNIVGILKKPDVVVALNSGLHEFSNHPEDTWKDSIPFLCQSPGVPLILTAYTKEEIIADINIVRKANKKVKVLVEPHRNPFSNLKPLRNFSSDIDPIYYINGFIAVLLKY